jgi:hypothetical protein
MIHKLKSINPNGKGSFTAYVDLLADRGVLVSFHSSETGLPDYSMRFFGDFNFESWTKANGLIWKSCDE